MRKLIRHTILIWNSYRKLVLRYDRLMRKRLSKSYSTISIFKQSFWRILHPYDIDRLPIFRRENNFPNPSTIFEHSFWRISYPYDIDRLQIFPFVYCTTCKYYAAAAVVFFTIYNGLNNGRRNNNNNNNNDNL